MCSKSLSLTSIMEVKNDNPYTRTKITPSITIKYKIEINVGETGLNDMNTSKTTRFIATFIKARISELARAISLGKLTFNMI